MMVTESPLINIYALGLTKKVLSALFILIIEEDLVVDSTFII